MNELGMRGENDILNRVTEQLIAQLHASENYANVKKYADGEYKAKIEKLENGFNSADTYWKLFLRAYNTNTEKRLLNTLTPEKANSILKNRYYRQAKAGASGDLCETIISFEREIKDILTKKRESLRTELKGQTARKKEYKNEIVPLTQSIDKIGKQWVCERRSKRNFGATMKKVVYVSGCIAVGIVGVTIMAGCHFIGLFEAIGAALGLGFTAFILAIIIGLFVALPLAASAKKNEKKLEKIRAIQEEIYSKNTLIRECENRIKTANDQIDVCNRVIGDK